MIQLSARLGAWGAGIGRLAALRGTYLTVALGHLFEGRGSCCSGGGDGKLRVAAPDGHVCGGLRRVGWVLSGVLVGGMYEWGILGCAIQPIRGQKRCRLGVERLKEGKPGGHLNEFGR